MRKGRRPDSERGEPLAGAEGSAEVGAEVVAEVLIRRSVAKIRRKGCRTKHSLDN
jgi:hypothetical protein